jgi:transcriptional regulator with XRE-family HTH domain
MFVLQSPEAISRVIGERIRVLRLARNLSQGELACMAGFSLSSIRRLESTGQGTLKLLASVALALQAVDALESLFVFPVETIAQAEAAARVGSRRRARKTSRYVAPH